MENSERSVTEVAIAPMRQADILEVVQLERACGLNSLGPAGFERQLARMGSIMLVARSGGGAIVGSLSGWVIADEFQIDNIVVAVSSRRMGIGVELIRRAARAAGALGAQKAVLEVRAANFAARVLYEGLGFALVGQRREYYRDPTDDALIMVCSESEWARLVA